MALPVRTQNSTPSFGPVAPLGGFAKTGSGHRPNVPVGDARVHEQWSMSNADASAPNDGSASARGEAPPIVAFPTPPAIKTDPRPNVAARRSALMV